MKSKVWLMCGSCRNLILLLVCLFFPSLSKAVVHGIPLNNPNILRSVVVIDGDGGNCTGIVIGHATILTAGHCMDNSYIRVPNTPRVVEIYTSSKRPAGLDEVVSNMAMGDFENVSAAVHDDIGILYLAKDLPADIQPFKIAASYSKQDEFCIVGAGIRSSTTVAGVTTIGRASGAPAFNLLCGLKISDDSKFPESLGAAVADLNDKIAGSADGDSGGPVLKESKNGDLELVGVIHGGPSIIGGSSPLAEDRNYTEFVDLTKPKYMSWVNKWRCAQVNDLPVDKSCR